MIEQSERGYGAGQKIQLFHKLLFTGKGKRTGVVFLPEFFQIHPLVTLDGNQVIIALFIVPYEQVFILALRMGKRCVGKL